MFKRPSNIIAWNADPERGASLTRVRCAVRGVPFIVRTAYGHMYGEMIARGVYRRHGVWPCAVMVMICGLAGLLAYEASTTTPVWQEPAHMLAGLRDWKSGEFDTITVNPPLVRCVATLPVVLQSRLLDQKPPRWKRRGRDEFAMAGDFIMENRHCWRRLFVTARLTCIPIAVLGAYVCAVCSRALFGISSGLVALAGWCFSPYVLGHGATIIPDVASAACAVAVVYCFWAWLQRPNWLGAIMAGVVLGLGELCKFTLLVFYPLLPALWFLYRVPERPRMTSREWMRQGGMLAALALVSVCLLNIGYLFEGTFSRLDTFRFRSTLFAGCEDLKEVPRQGANRFAETWLGNLPVLLPANMVQGIDTQRYDFERHLPSYLRGEWADHGWWYYYLYALAVKMPLGTWCLVGLAICATLFGKGYNAAWRDEMVLLTPALAILVFVSSQSGFSVHSRYVIPAIPFLLIWTSKVGRIFQTLSRTRKGFLFACAVVTALSWSVMSSLWVYPHSLSYFNESVHGPRCGGEVLLDSNIDWGQDLLRLREWLDKHSGVKLDGLACFASYPVMLVGIAETPLPVPGPVDGHPVAEEMGPRSGWYAVSVNYLYDRSGRYRYFLRFTPAAMAGYSICIYHITREQANRVRRDLGMPELSRDDVAGVRKREIEQREDRDKRSTRSRDRIGAS